MSAALFRCMLLAAVLAAAGALAQVAGEANTGIRTPEARSRLARRLNAQDRDARQRPQQLVEAMKLAPGMTVADIGTGGGYMLRWLSPAVGPTGRVLAEEIFPDMLEIARGEAGKQKLSNVTFILGTDRDPRLPAGEVDVALVLDAYHHFDYPQEMLAGIRKGLKPGGRLIIVEYYPEHFGNSNHVRFTEKELIEEVMGAGFELVASTPFNPGSQYLAEFRKP